LAARHFVDSNIFIYALDAKNLAKMDRAQAVVNRLSEAESGLISVQVLNETYSNLVKVSKLAMPPDEARQSVETIIDAFPVEQLTLDHVRDAMRISVQFQTSYYDGLLFAVARAAGAVTMLTEDLQAEQVIDGVRILHVLDDDFDLSRLA
jgi:predicted nucleic acid-binding protein